MIIIMPYDVMATPKSFWYIFTSSKWHQDAKDLLIYIKEKRRKRFNQSLTKIVYQNRKNAKETLSSALKILSTLII